jgi:hypothetical protein
VRTRSTRGQRGVAFPSPVAILSVVAVAMAGIAFVATKDQPPTEREVRTVSTPAENDPTPTSTPIQTLPAERQKPIQPQVVRGDVYVEVYNNSGISGLAGRVAGVATDGI